MKEITKPWRQYWYNDILRLYGDIVFSYEDDDYQGETVAILFDETKGYGFIVFSWGSCSVCDELQACESKHDFDYLVESMYNSIHWEETKENLAKWMQQRDWKGQHCWWKGRIIEIVGGAMKAIGFEYKQEVSE